jgi:hypothetical protein
MADENVDPPLHFPHGVTRGPHDARSEQHKHDVDDDEQRGQGHPSRQKGTGDQFVYICIDHAPGPVHDGEDYQYCAADDSDEPEEAPPPQPSPCGIQHSQCDEVDGERG